MTFNKPLNLLIAMLKDKLIVWEPELELPPKPQSTTTTVVTTVTYPAAKAPEKKEHYIGELEGPYTPNSVLGELGPRGATLQSSSSLKPRDSLASALASKKAINLHKDMQQYATIF